MAVMSGLITGLMGYSLKKEMLGDALFYRELQTFHYEIYSVTITGLSPNDIQSTMYREFSGKYSGDINVKVFSMPADYYFPNDSIRAAKFDVEIQVKTVPSIDLWQPELATSYYAGLDSNFFKSSGYPLLDFKEGFNFEVNENGVQIFSHDISFGLLTGNKNIAINFASGIYAKDKDTTFGISTMVGGISTIADSTQYQNYYSESYDTIRNMYSFGRKREVLPSGVSTYVFNLLHTLDLKEDGTIDISEKGNVKGKLSFLQSQQGAETLIGAAFGRCSTFYSTYAPVATNYPLATPIATTSPLVSVPIKVTHVFNRPSISTDYEVTFTNNAQYKSDGTFIGETFDISDAEIGVIDIKHSLDFSYHKRKSPNTLFALIDSAMTSSPSVVSGYYNNYTGGSVWPIHNIRKEVAWPNRKSKGARLTMEYSNHPKYFVTINGMSFRSLEGKVAHQKPVDIVNEYKVINRPSHMSLLNYAYQTEKGQITVTVNAGIGRTPDEFIAGFRSDLGAVLYNLYGYAAGVFFQEFKGIIPIAFTYFLQDVHYTYTSENGGLQLVGTFGYTLKKYII